MTTSNPDVAAAPEEPARVRVAAVLVGEELFVHHRAQGAALAEGGRAADQNQGRGEKESDRHGTPGK